MGVTSIALQFTIVDMLSKGISTIKERLLSISSASKEVKRDFDRMAASFKYAAMSGIAAREMYKGLKPAIGLAGELQSEMIGVKAELMGAGKDARTLNRELSAVKSTAFEVQAWTPFDMTQIVALEKQLVKAGAKVEDITGKTGAAAASAALAVYEGLDPVRTGEAIIGIGTPFKITADKYMELADTISRAASASVVGAAEIAESAKYAAGPMAALGKSSKEMLALSAVMAQVGISGSMAGVALKEFFLQASKKEMFHDAKGNLLPTLKMIDILREKLKGMGEARKAEVLAKVFGERGMQAVIALLNEGKGSYQDILQSMDSGVSLQEKLNESMTGFKNQMLSLKGTFKSTIADLFQPALPVLTSLVGETNEFVASIGRAAQKRDSIGKGVTGLSFAAAGIGGLATLALGGAGLYYGRKVLRGVGGVKGLLKGAGSTAGGIAQGKAIEAATGVAPVFVTNWPDGFGGTPSETLAGMAVKTGALKDILAGSARSALSLKGAGLVGATAIAGYAVGSALNAGIDALVAKITGEDKKLGGAIYDLMHGQGITNKISIAIDKEGRVVQEGNIAAEVTLNRGSFAPAN